MVIVVRVALVALFTTVTVAPGSTPPCAVFDFSGDGTERLTVAGVREDQAQVSAREQNPAHGNRSFPEHRHRNGEPQVNRESELEDGVARE